MVLARKGFFKSAILAVAMLVAMPRASEAQLTVDIPHTWSFVYSYARSTIHPQNIGAFYETSELRSAWAWLYPGFASYSLYNIKDAQNNFTGLGRAKYVDINTLPAPYNDAQFCTQQNIPVPTVPGLTVPGVLRQVWELSPSPLGPQNLRRSVFCSGPITSTIPWYVFVLDGANPLTSTVVAVFRS